MMVYTGAATNRPSASIAGHITEDLLTTMNTRCVDRVLRVHGTSPLLPDVETVVRSDQRLTTVQIDLDVCSRYDNFINKIIASSSSSFTPMYLACVSSYCSLLRGVLSNE